MDAFSLLYSELLLAKLSLFVFGATFAASPWQFIAIYSYFICTLVTNKAAYIVINCQSDAAKVASNTIDIFKRSWPRGHGVRL